MPKTAARIFYLLVILSLVFAGQGFAGQCANGPCCDESGIKGPIVRPRHNVGKDGQGDIDLGGLTVLSGILAIGQGLRAGSNKTAATVDNNFKGQDAYARQVIASFGVSRERAENNRMFGPDSRAYNTFDDDFDSRATAGLVARNQLSDKLRGDFRAYSREFDTKKQVLGRLQNAPPGFEAAAGETLSPRGLAVGKETIKTIIDPSPALNLNENLDQSPAAESYKSTRKVKDARLLIPIAVLGELLADRAPVMEMSDWAGQVYEKMGGEGKPSCVSEDGNLSMNGLLRMLTDMRFANQDWAAGHGGLHGIPKTGVLRELLAVKVDKLMVEYRNMLWMDRTAALMAQKQLSRGKEFNQVLNHAQNNTLR